MSMNIPFDLIILIIVIVLAISGEYIASSAVLLFREIDRNIIKPYIDNSIGLSNKPDKPDKQIENMFVPTRPIRERFVIDQSEPIYNKPPKKILSPKPKEYKYNMSVLDNIINPKIDSVDDRLLKQKLILGKKAEESLTIRSGFQNKYQYMKYHNKELQDSSNRGGSSWWGKDDLELQAKHISI